jgi:hypothetical protein
MVHSRDKWGRRERQPWGRASRRDLGAGEPGTEDHHQRWWLGERGKRKQRKKKEQGLMSNRYREKGASLVDALLHYKGASEADALPTDVAWSSDLAGSVGRHHPWCPSLHRGRQEGWCPVLGSRYGISSSKGLFIKNCF